MANHEKQSFEQARAQMVNDQLRLRGITDESVLAVMGRIPRHLFVSTRFEHAAYSDCPIEINCGQTVSQPYMVAVMTQRLAVSPGLRILEIGTGSGYQTAVLAAMGAEVFTVERHKQLVDETRSRLTSLGYLSVWYRVGDGTLGWPDQAPFDRILVTAGAPDIPAELRRQLADGGRLVIPVGTRSTQTLTLVRREGQQFYKEKTMSCVFVPLVGESGWPYDSP